MGDVDTETDDPSAGPTYSDDGHDSDRTLTAERGPEKWTHRRYRVGIVALGVLGVVMGLAGVVFPGARTLLFALSATGLFGAVLLYVLVPERFVTATLARRTYEPLAEIGPLLVETAGLAGRQVYVPEGGAVRLVVPGAAVAGVGSRVPDRYEDESFGGLSLPTTGNGLLAEFHERGHGPLATHPEELLQQLLDALVEEFELVERASGRSSPATSRATVAIEGSQYGPPTTFDHPVTAFLAAGMAAGLETPVTVEPPYRDGDDRYVVGYGWQEPVAVTGRPADGRADWEFPAASSAGWADESSRE